jgi:hypothetical protein
MSISEPIIINFPKKEDPRGNLSFIEEEKHIPFKIERVYWVYDVPGGQVRGGHAFREQQELIVALSGSFDVVIDDGNRKQIFHLNRSYYGYTCLLLEAIGGFLNKFSGYGIKFYCFFRAGLHS